MELNTFISRLFSAAEAAGIAPAEAACSQSDSFRVRVRRGELEDYQVSENAGLTLRGRVNGRIGTASTQALTEESIPLLIQGVLESAALIETDEQDDILPPDDSYASVCNDSEAVTALTAEQKIALAREIDEKLRSDDPRLTPDTCAVATGEETFTLKNTLGLDLSHHSNMIYAMANVVARDGEHAAPAYETRWGYGLDAIDAETLAESCKRESLMKLDAGRMKSGAYPVVIKNSAMGDLLATFCGVFSADNVQKGLSLLAGREGETIASASVTLTDDPLMPMGMASCPFDREGTAREKFAKLMHPEVWHECFTAPLTADLCLPQHAALYADMCDRVYTHMGSALEKMTAQALRESGRDEKDAKRLTGVALYGILMMARRGDMTLEGAMDMIAQVIGLDALAA